MSTTYRVFISSPSDVFAERERVERVIARLNGEFGGGVLEAVRWERTYYTAAKTFQDQIPLPSQTDIVVCVFWKRLGFELPPDYRRADGTVPTGTEFEFEDAMAAARRTGTPDVLVYRKAAPVLLDAEQVEAERAQFQALKAFWSRWFQNEAGNFTAAYQAFATTDEFEGSVETHLRQWLERHRVRSSGVTWSVALQGSPFRGLQAFDAGHAGVFFGRRRAVELGRERLVAAAGRGMAFLLVLGASGAGKSSVARAGLVPRLTAPGTVPGVDVWRSCVVRPSEGETPLLALAGGLYGAVPELAAGDSPAPADLAALLAHAPEAAARALRQALGRATAGLAVREGFERAVEVRVLLVVDQFEEALQPGEVREGFARALAALRAGGLTWVVGTLRSDLYALFQASPGLMALREGGAQLDLLPPDGAELAEIVTGPAAAAGLGFERRADGLGLDEALIAAASQPGALPLLQLELEALFEGRSAEGALTWACYEAGGGLAGVVERRAEAALEGLDAEARAALPEVLRRLVDVEEDGVVTSRAARLPGEGAALRLVEGFVAARLLVREGGRRFRVAHDALLTGWPRAAALIAGDREMLRARGRVEQAARRWVAEGRHEDFLLPHGRPLIEAAELVAAQAEALGPEGAALVAASLAAETARREAAEAARERELTLEAAAQQARADAALRVARRTRVAALAVSGLLVLAAGAAGFAWVQRDEARRQTAAAERSFQAALAGGSSLMDVVTGHLRDGGMTRAVATALLGTAEGTLGGLAERAGTSAIMNDVQGRLSASLATVQLATCDAQGAAGRAREAVRRAEAALAAAPDEGRIVALLERLDTLLQALTATQDYDAAQGAFERAEAVAAGAAPRGAVDTAMQAVRRSEALLLAVRGNQAGAARMAREDLAWQRAAGGSRALAAQDLRFLAARALQARQWAEAGPLLDEEKGILGELAAGEPDSLEWRRALSIHLGRRAQLDGAQGRGAAALAEAQQAAAMAREIAARDPGNDEWKRDLALASVRLGAMTANRDAEEARQAMLPVFDGLEALTAPRVTSRSCLDTAAFVHGVMGEILYLKQDMAGAVREQAAALAVRERIAGISGHRRSSVQDMTEAQRRLAEALLADKRPGEAAAHAKAGLAGLEELLGREPDNAGWQDTADALGITLGDAAVASGDLAGGVAAYQGAAARASGLKGGVDGAAWRHREVTALLRLASASLLQGRPAQQVDTLRKALAAADEGGPEATGPGRTDGLDVRQALGLALFVTGDPGGGVQLLREAAERGEALVARMPADMLLRRKVSLTLTLLGKLLELQGDAAGSAGAAERSRAIVSP